MSQAGRDPLVACPFNRDHLINRSRLQHHIIKCSRHYPNYFICSYNVLHRFLTKEEHTRHIISCPDMTFLTPWKYCNPKQQQGNIQETPYHHEGTRSFNLAEENWSAEYENQEDTAQ